MYWIIYVIQTLFEMSLSLVLNQNHSGYFTDYIDNENTLKSCPRRTIFSPGLSSSFELWVSALMGKFGTSKRWMILGRWKEEGEGSAARTGFDIHKLEEKEDFHLFAFYYRGII